MPQFNDLLSTGKGKYQGIVVVGVYIRYFTDTAHLVNQGIQNCFRDFFGRAGGFAQGIVSGADPDGAGFPDLSAVMLATTGTGNHATEGVFFRSLLLSVLLRPAVYFQLYRVIGADINDRLVGIGGMVLGQLTVIHQGALGQVVLPVLGLEQKIAGVSVILEDAGDGALVPGESLLGEDALLIQPLHDGGDALAI